ncbi:homeodomain-interacting protein kinase 3-like [Gouania willdenowi]|uniref:homeodomain-interacting protein kinase 3-like n=1 Tax=Gouania willdenowi TaxID=441366 RepID=UPI0010555556|nr:homeodomain-interacting protein kinase 3-like [Gouania willdenowi]
MILQPIGYRAPEVCLGLPFSGAIDMWGVGCTLAFLYLNDHLFPIHCEYLMMKCMVEMLGMPSKYHLRFGMYSQRFFCKEDEFGTQWRLLTPEEYSSRNKKKAEEWPKSRAHFSSLDDLLYISEVEDAEEMEDRKVFIDFLKELLHLDGDLRISPVEALQHPFITGSYLSQPRSQTAENTYQMVMEEQKMDWIMELWKFTIIFVATPRPKSVGTGPQARRIWNRSSTGCSPPKDDGHIPSRLGHQGDAASRSTGRAPQISSYGHYESTRLFASSWRSGLIK